MPQYALGIDAKRKWIHVDIGRNTDEYFFVIVQRIGVTVTTIEVARQCYAELLVHLIDQHIRDSSNISTEELKSYITLEASDHSSRTPLLDDFLAP